MQHVVLKGNLRVDLQNSQTFFFALSNELLIHLQSMTTGGGVVEAAEDRRDDGRLSAGPRPETEELLVCKGRGMEMIKSPHNLFYAPDTELQQTHNRSYT